MMMHETPEDDMFTQLLSEYSAPVQDNGFSASMMAMIASQETQATTNVTKNKKLKAVIVGSAAILGGGYAALQIPNLLDLIRGVSLPNMDIAMPILPELAVPAVDATLFSSNYMTAAAALMAMMFVWIAGTLTFGNNT